MASSFVIPSRPPALPITKTCVFKTVNDLPIYIDVYLPLSSSTPPFSIVDGDDLPRPILLFVHGGGWTGSNRGDYSRPLFQHFLDAGFIVASMDYRLVPESSNLDQLEDVRDVEEWLRKEMPSEIGEKAPGEVDEIAGAGARKIVVAGASAGSQLALLIPKLWKIQPAAMLILYPPTNMHELPYSGRGRLAALTLPPATHALLSEATTFDTPPTQKAIPKSAMDYLAPRVVMSTHMFRGELVAEVLLRGLKVPCNGSSKAIKEQANEVNDKNSDVLLKLPEKGSVSEAEVDEICPLHYLHTLPSIPPKPGATFSYPPTYLLAGTNDEVFAPETHSLPFYQELRKQEIPAEIQLVNGLGHAFDVWAQVGDWIGEEILRAAVEWVEGWVR